MAMQFDDFEQQPKVLEFLHDSVPATGQLYPVLPLSDHQPVRSRCMQQGPQATAYAGMVDDNSKYPIGLNFVLLKCIYIEGVMYVA